MINLQDNPIAGGEAPDYNSIVTSLLVRWRDAPVLFVRECLGVEPDTWQANFMNAVVTNDRVAVKAARGVGKSTTIAWLGMWWLLTRKPARVIYTANKIDQLSDVIWGEWKLWHERMSEPFKGVFDIQADKIILKALPSNSAMCRAARQENPEALQGQHSKNLLWIIDEASGVPQMVYDVGVGSLTTENAKIVLTGNPTRAKGFFYDAFTRRESPYVTLSVSAFDAKMVNKKWIEDQRKEWGESSLQWQVFVLGQFPKDDSLSFIPRHLIEDAVGRKVQQVESYHAIWGLDVARFGSNRSALAKRRGNVLLEPVKWWRGLDTMELADVVYEEFRAVQEREPENSPLWIVVDAIGLGAGVADRLGRSGLGLPVIALNVAEQPSSKDKYMRKRDELWGRARQWFNARSCCIPDDQDLIDELSTPPYDTTSTGKIQIWQKSRIEKELGLPSPDLADAFIHTFAVGWEKTEQPLPKRVRDAWASRSPEYSKHSWMSL